MFMQEFEDEVAIMGWHCLPVGKMASSLSQGCKIGLGGVNKSIVHAQQGHYHPAKMTVGNRVL